MAKQFTAVVVGAGGISNAWFPPLAKEKVEIGAVVDLNKASAEAALDKHGIDAEASTDMKAAIKKHDPDFVVDLTTPEAHCAVTCAALSAGCHVIGEKPMASSMTEARRMVKAAEKAKKLYMVSQSRRYCADLDSFRRAVGKGVIGDITTVNCDFYIGAHFGGFRDEMDSPLILDMSIHHFDLLRYFTDLDPKTVYAREFNPKASWYKGDVSASCIFEMSDDVIFTYRGSWCSEGCHTSWHGDWRIIGTKGTVCYENGTVRGEVLAGKGGFNRKLKPAKFPKQTLKYGGQHGALREFLKCLRGGNPPQGECHDNIKSLAMVFGAIDSSKKGRKTKIRVM